MVKAMVESGHWPMAANRTLPVAAGPSNVRCRWNAAVGSAATNRTCRPSGGSSHTGIGSHLLPGRRQAYTPRSHIRNDIMAKLDGAKVVVIGGASGVGFAVAAAALEAGAEVVVGSSQTPRIEAAAEKLGRGAKGQTVDVKDEASVAAFFDAAGRFDHLVFTAGDWGNM